MSVRIIIKVLSARHLLPMDSNGYSDPYVVVKYDKVKKNTKVVKKSLEPIWNETFEFEVEGQPYPFITLKVWDHDFVSSHDFIGAVKLSVTQLFISHVESREPQLPVWLNLRNRKNQHNGRGDLKVHVFLEGRRDLIESIYSSFKSIQDQEKEDLQQLALSHGENGKSKYKKIVGDKNTPKGFLYVRVVGAKNLPPFSGFTVDSWDMDPFVTVTVSGEVQKTPKVVKNCDPIWNYPMLFPVTSNALLWPVIFSIHDHDKLSQNDYVGNVQLPFSTIKEASQNIPFVLNLSLSKCAPPNHVSTLTLITRYSSIMDLKIRLWTDLIEIFDDASKNSCSMDFSSMALIFGLLGVEGAEEVLDDAYKKLEFSFTSNLDKEQAFRLLNSVFETHAKSKDFMSLGKCFYCVDTLFKGMPAGERITHMAECILRKTTNTMKLWHSCDIYEERKSGRNWFLKAFKKASKVTAKEPEIKASISVIDRETQQKFDEHFSLRARICMCLIESALYSPDAIQKIQPIQLSKIDNVLKKIKHMQIRKYTSFSSRNEIPLFINHFNINPRDFELPIQRFKNMDEFFQRKIKTSERPIQSKTDNIAVCSADSRVSTYISFSDSQSSWPKEKRFNVGLLLEGEGSNIQKNKNTEVKDTELDNLIKSRPSRVFKIDEWGSVFEDCAVSVFRIALQDSHCFYSPVAGRIISIYALPLVKERFLSATPSNHFSSAMPSPDLAKQAGADFHLCDLGSDHKTLPLARQCGFYRPLNRKVIIIESPDFGHVAVVAINSGSSDFNLGAEEQERAREEGPPPNSAICTRGEGYILERGDELGYFGAFSRSESCCCFCQVVVLFPRLSIIFDEDLAHFSVRGTEVRVKLGMPLGSSVRQ